MYLLSASEYPNDTQAWICGSINRAQDFVTASVGSESYQYILTANVLGEAGNGITLYMPDEQTSVGNSVSGDTLTGGEDKYDVYAWLEEEDGSAGWVRVDEAYDIATTEIYGLSKLGTDTVVTGGAPVGHNASGGMAVPLAGVNVAGASRLGTADALTGSTGGVVGANSAGQLLARAATTSSLGTVMFSTSEVLDSSGSVGKNSKGQTDVRRATSTQYGLVKVGSAMSVLNNRPYQLAVAKITDGVTNEFGTDVSGQLANNLVFGGALQNGMQAHWVAADSPGIDTSVMDAGGYYLGLATSESFTQAGGRLTLCSGSSALLGGCYVVGADEYGAETRADAVPNVAALAASAESVRTWVSGELVSYALADDVYTKTQVDDRFDDVYTRAQVDDAFLKKDAAEGLYMRRSEQVGAVCVLGLSEYQALRVRDDVCVYLVTED